MTPDPAATPSSPSRLNRRRLVKLGLAGASLALLGCASGTRRSGVLPGPVWPDTPSKREDTGFRVEPGRLARPGGVRPRSQWTSERTIASRANRMIAPNRITVHHDGMPPISFRSESDSRKRLAQIRNSHVGLGWADIGYHFVVDPFGTVWEGRPLTFQGAHVKDQNPRNVGVMVLGHFDRQSPTPQATDALDRFLAALMVGFDVPIQRVMTHQEFAPTACPGRSLQAHMDRARAYNGSLRRLASGTFA